MVNLVDGNVWGMMQIVSEHTFVGISRLGKKGVSGGEGAPRLSECLSIKKKKGTSSRSCWTMRYAYG